VSADRTEGGAGTIPAFHHSGVAHGRWATDERADVVTAHASRFRTGAVVAVLALAFSLLAVTSPSPVGATVAFTARGSINQVSVTGLTPGAGVDLHDSGGNTVSLTHHDWESTPDVADAQGAYLFRGVAAGSGYTVVSEGQSSAPVTVTDPDANPPASFYQQPNAPVLTSGFTYIPTRDGTTLSANITFPDPAVYPQPWPVLVDYSGYDPSQPGNAPAEAALFPYQGYVVVGLNVRGTTCSGGAFDFFEELQNRDGYDAIETLANQPWSNGDVGMVGISYMGISQLFVAQTQPPHLRAITPLSVIADTFRSTLYPGGILNTGFAVAWATDRVNSAKPAAHQWVKDRISGGDTVCAENQKLRLQSVDLLKKIDDNPYYLASGGDQLSPRTFVDKIKVPTYIGGAFQDEQTGGAWSTMLDQFDPATKVRAFLTNGTHTESLAPQDIVRLTEFIDFYVGKRIPKVSPLVRFAAPSVLKLIFGGSAIGLPPDRFTGAASYGAALASYESENPIRVVWENGAGRNPGEPIGTAESTFAAWPVPGTIATPLYLQPDGQLGSTPSAVADTEARASSSYIYDPSSKRPSTFDGGSDAIFRAETQTSPDIHWDPLAEGDSSSYVTAPFTTETALAGEGAVDLWLRSTAPDTDIEVTLTEVRPDGKEEYIQSGWLRASHRKLDSAQSTPLAPFHTDLAADASPLPAGEFTPVEVGLFPFAHVIRPGSRLRLNIEAPGGNQPLWQFDSLHPVGTQVNDIGHSIGRPSRVLLPVLPADLNPGVPATVPACPALRNQPCRPYLPARVATSVAAVPSGADLLVSWAPPASGGTPDAYRITAQPSGQTLEVTGDLTSVAVPDLDLHTAYSFRVTAVYGTTAAPASDASLAVEIGTVVPTEPSSSSGDLPVTGSQTGMLLVAGLGLLVVGAALVLASRRRPKPVG
jgi:LPXTG-motif cell wall-anchored protein